MAPPRSSRNLQSLLSILATQNERSGRRSQKAQPTSAVESLESDSDCSSSSEELSSDELPPPSPSPVRTKRRSGQAKKPGKSKSKTKSKTSVKAAAGTDEQTLSELRSLVEKLSKARGRQSGQRSRETDIVDLTDLNLDESAEDASEESPSVDSLLEVLLQAADIKNKGTDKRGSKVEFARCDQIWDPKIHNYRLKETVNTDSEGDGWDKYVFTVRRQFDVEGKFLSTFVDVKSKPLKECLKKVAGNVKGINLLTDTPVIEPNMLFLYLEEFRDLVTALKEQTKTIREKKLRRNIKIKAQHLSLLVKYLDQDYADTKKALYPMLAAGCITFEYLWALFKPNTSTFTATYGDEDEPRAFRIDHVKNKTSFTRGSYYLLEGRFLEYDGKSFGMATLYAEIFSFQGARKISSLPCYPLQYHKESEQMRAQLIDRGKKFVSLQGANYKAYGGMAYVKKKDTVLKIDVNSRVMVDPKGFRRINPNYALSNVKPHDGDIGEVDDELFGRDVTSESDSTGQPTPASGESDKRKPLFKLVRDDNGSCKIVPVDFEDESDATVTKLEDPSTNTDIFSEEDLLVTSPVVLGFSFNEKLWLEFAVAKLSEVQWNDGAFDALILPEKQKMIVKALVSSHAFHPSRSIDDVIAGKGKGLVATLFGSPGVGKTLTVESIADLLRRPLYMVSAGDLGTDSRTLERELQNVLDVAHSWGAVLLLDEADVFLERRSVHDIHRNALVSIFLRLLEYFQGILFLTTNRVEVFDDAFVSRIHLSLRYDDLSTKAKKTVWKTFIEKVRKMDDMEVDPLLELDYDDLARKNLNGRQIKNIVRTAQALAISEKAAMSLSHIKTVIDVAQSFERDLKGGSGYEDAMRSYT